MIIIALSAFGGGILAAILGWLDSKEEFDPRKFAKSIGFAFLAGLGFAVGYQLSDGPLTRDCLVALLSGAGWDAVTNRTLGAMGR